jgi:hypothetical protein
MNPRELRDKITQAQSVGAPIFFTEDELDWLFKAMLESADYYNDLRNRGCQLGKKEKEDFRNAVAIGTKCALELGKK